MNDRTRRRLEELQADILLETGTRVTQEELLSVLVEEAYTSRDTFLSLFRSASVPLTESERSAFHAHTSAGGGTDEDDADHDDTDPDEVLYA